MNEHLLQLMASLKIVWLAVFSYFYGEGGISGKWKRRFVGASWMMLGVFGFSMLAGTWNVWYLLFLPLLIGALSNGYSSNSTTGKILRRGIYGFFISLCSIPLVAFSHAYVLFSYSVALSVVCSASLGAFNPCKNAREEETLIATMCLLLTLFLI